MKAISKDGKPILLKHPTDKYKVDSIPLKNGEVKILSYSDGSIVVHIQEDNTIRDMWCSKEVKVSDIQDNDNFLTVEVVNE